MHRYPLRVRYADTDQMGFAYYGHYLRWFEIGRVELFRSMGMRYRDLDAGGVWLPVLEARCRYLKPARYDDLLAIETGVLRLARASVEFGYRVLRESDSPEILATGATEHCFMGRDGHPLRPPPALADLLARSPRATGQGW